MAWIIGLLTKEELSELNRRGWRDEDPPKELRSSYEDGTGTCTEHGEELVIRAFFVDNNVFNIMTGPDWET